MQRLAVLALCALVALATIWLLVRSGPSRDQAEGDDGLDAAWRSAASEADRLDPAHAAGGLPRASARSGEPRSGGGLAEQGDSTGAQAGNAGFGSSAPVTPAPRSGMDSSERRAEGDALRHAAGGPADAPRSSQQPLADEFLDPTDLAALEPGPSDSDEPGVRGHVLTPEEARLRAKQKYPDGSLPKDELEKVRDLDTKQTLKSSAIAFGFLVPPKAETPEDRATVQPPQAIPRMELPVVPPSEERQEMHGAGEGSAR